MLTVLALKGMLYAFSSSLAYLSVVFVVFIIKMHLHYSKEVKKANDRH